LKKPQLLLPLPHKQHWSKRLPKLKLLHKPRPPKLLRIKPQPKMQPPELLRLPRLLPVKRLPTQLLLHPPKPRPMKLQRRQQPPHKRLQSPMNCLCKQPLLLLK
jgi:hypothetical protein